jgi:hypothetical protein
MKSRLISGSTEKNIGAAKKIEREKRAIADARAAVPGKIKGDFTTGWAERK